MVVFCLGGSGGLVVFGLVVFVFGIGGEDILRRWGFGGECEWMVFWDLEEYVGLLFRYFVG